MRMGEGGSLSVCLSESLSEEPESVRECESASNVVVTVYMVYAPVMVEVRFEGEWTRTRNGGTLVRQDGPASTKCRSASTRLPRKLSRFASSSSTSLGRRCGCEVDASSEVPWRTNSSAPLVTKLENLFKLLPPSRLRRKLGNHSPVVCGTIGRASAWRTGDPRGVIDPVDASRLLRPRVC